MKITLHTNELKPTTLAALDGNCGETDADRLLELNDADFNVIDAYRRLATAS